MVELTNQIRYAVLVEAGDRSFNLGSYTRSQTFYYEAKDYATSEQKRDLERKIRDAIQGSYDAMDR